MKRVPVPGLTVALIYTRVSSDEQADGLSLDTQLAECRRYAAMQPGWVLGGEFQDVLKGTRDDRPDYQRVLAEVRRLLGPYYKRVRDELEHMR